MTARQADRFEVIFSRYSAGVLGYLLRRLEDSEDAADLMAEVFAIAWRRIDTVPPGEEARLFLYGIARNVLANHRRGSVRRNRLADRLRQQLAVRTKPDSVPNSSDALTEALADLPAADRELLTLTAWEQLTPAEIATLLDLDSATVRARLTRARGRLRRLLDSRTGTDPDEPSPGPRTRVTEAR
jgi:RNA polymerase sigma-70 factor, ECF subfamily